MLNDTATLIDEVIDRLEGLRSLLAEDASVCRIAGLRSDERHCADALDGIARLLPSLERARLSQDTDFMPGPRRCMNCED